MKQFVLAVLVASLSATGAVAQTTQTQTGASAAQSAAVSAANSQANAASQLATGTTFRAQLDKSVDAKKAKVGDKVIAKSAEDVKSGGNVIIPKGSKLLGHVSEVKAAAKGSQNSALGIAFDKAVLKNGTEVPLNVTIQALAVSRSEASAAMSAPVEPMGGPAMGGGMAPVGRPGLVGGAAGSVGGMAGTAGAATGAAGATAGAIGGVGAGASGAINRSAPLSMNGQLDSNAHGVVGLPGLGLNAGASQGSVVASNKGNVRLDSGTQMVLRANGHS